MEKLSMFKKTALVLAMSLMAPIAALGPTAAEAAPDNQSFVRFSNRWKPTQVIHIQNGKPEAGSVPASFWSADWTLEEVGQYYRIRNRWKPAQVLHIQNGKLESGVAQAGWWSAQWTIEPVDNDYFRIRNRWKPDQVLHIQNGKLESGSAKLGWWSAQWVAH